jgi:hypothetical protein
MLSRASNVARNMLDYYQTSNRQTNNPISMFLEMITVIPVRLPYVFCSM